MQTLSEHLAANNMTQGEFAKRIGVAQSTISKICRDKLPSLKLAQRIAVATGDAVPVGIWGSQQAQTPKQNTPSGAK